MKAKQAWKIAWQYCRAEGGISEADRKRMQLLDSYAPLAVYSLMDRKARDLLYEAKFGYAIRETNEDQWKYELECRAEGRLGGVPF
jgi:hypothetical protein